MDEAAVRRLLDDVRSGALTADDAVARLRRLPFADLGFAKVDHHRELRQGACEIVFAQGKTVGEVAAIVARLLEANEGPVLVSRASAEQRAVVRSLADASGLPVEERERPGTIAIVRGVRPATGCVAVVTAGTSDLPVAEEAALTATMLGAGVQMVADVGVAGLHRLVAARPMLDAADVVVVCAGMDAALASVVGGLVSAPVIACPTSVGYGSTFGGLSALLSMLSSCAPGVVCVGIDDGVGAGYAAATIARRVHAEASA